MTIALSILAAAITISVIALAAMAYVAWRDGMDL